MVRRVRGFALFLVLALIFPVVLSFTITGSVQGNGSLLDTVYVNGATGDDTFDGSSPLRGTENTGPKQTIHGGMDAAAAGGTIHVAAGTYTEVIWIGKNLTLSGAGALFTFINPDYLGDPVLQVSTGGSSPSVQAIISGFTIQNGSNDDFTGNGGGVWVGSSCTAYLAGCNIINNEADMGGGVFINDGATVYLTDCRIAGNRANYGGGIYNCTGTLHMDRCCVSGNSAAYQGGGINNALGQAWLTNCTISSNQITAIDFSSGGGIYNESDMTLLNCTLAYNFTSGTSMTKGGGFADFSTSTMTFKNTIVAYNTAGGLYDNGYSAYDSVVSLGYNLDSENSCGFNSNGDKRNTDPLLGPLQNNGGPTSTHAITASSPAFNGGTSAGAPATDQRGVPRPAGRCSMGAYEPASPDTRTASVSTGLGTVNFIINSGSLSRVEPTSVANLRCMPSGFSFPYGYFSFNITNLTAGQNVYVTIRFPNPLPIDTRYYKCQNGLIIDCFSIMSRPDPYTIVLNLTDGSDGDADGIANGTIVDPGGPAFPLHTPQSSSASLTPVIQQKPVVLANIFVKSASLSAATAVPGAPVTVTADVANTGNSNGAAVIRVYVNGSEEASQGITVNNGGSNRISFTITRNEPGNYQVYVNNVNSGSFVVAGKADPDIILLVSSGLVLLSISGLAVLWTRRRYS